MGLTAIDSELRSQPLARACRWAAFIACAWLAAWPHPYAIVFAFAAAMPWLLALLRARGRPFLPRADIVMLQALCAGVLAMRAVLDSRLVLIGPLLMPGAIGALALVVLTLWADRASWPWRKLAPLALVAFGYALAATALADQVFDAQPAMTAQLRVLGKRTSSGKGSVMYLRVPAWGLRRRENDVQVPADLYRETVVGASVCVVVHPGALGMPWYEVRAAC